MISSIGILKRSIRKSHREVTALKSGEEFVRCEERVRVQGNSKGKSRGRAPRACSTEGVTHGK